MTLDAAAYADKAGLWIGNKSKVILDRPIGVHGGTGTPPSVINVYRNKNGVIHSAPGNIMINLLQLLNDSKSAHTEWMLLNLKLFIYSVSKIQPEWHFDWEEGNENWVRVMSSNALIGYISAELPIAFFHVSHTKKIINSIQCSFPKIHKIADFDTPVFSVDRFQMQDVFGRQLSENLDYERLSVNDLWWATVH